MPLIDSSDGVWTLISHILKKFAFMQIAQNLSVRGCRLLLTVSNSCRLWTQKVLKISHFWQFPGAKMMLVLYFITFWKSCFVFSVHSQIPSTEFMRSSFLNQFGPSLHIRFRRIRLLTGTCFWRKQIASQCLIWVSTSLSMSSPRESATAPSP